MSKVHYAKSVRDEALRLIEAGEQSISEIARRVGVSAWTLYRWRREYANLEELASTAYDADLIGENIRLRAELLRVTEERDILKKAALLLAK